MAWWLPLLLGGGGYIAWDQLLKDPTKAALGLDTEKQLERLERKKQSKVEEAKADALATLAMGEELTQMHQDMPGRMQFGEEQLQNALRVLGTGGGYGTAMPPTPPDTDAAALAQVARMIESSRQQPMTPGLNLPLRRLSGRGIYS
jgi:hypothetical protein